MNILVLYSRLSDYFIACLKEDIALNNNFFLVFRYYPSKQAPFNFKSEKNLKIYNESNFKKNEILEKAAAFKPDLVYVSGWKNKKYLFLAKKYKLKGINVVLTMDNHWKKEIKQYFFTLFSRFFLLSRFTHIWIPGQPQYEYAKKLGFKKNRIITGLYCANENLFKTINQSKFNRQFLFIGRLVEHKGLIILFNVINKLIEEKKLNFKFHFVGNGPLLNHIPKHPNIKHTQFINPIDLPNILKNAGIFILPSLYEAWGVVIHEAVLSGLPVITTYQTGASSEFIINNKNGFLYNAKNEKELKNIILSSVNMTESEYFKMSTNSKKLSDKINLTNWSKQLNFILNEK